jgi:hypothetical protein
MPCRSTSIWDSIDVATLQARVNAMLLALADLDSGAKVVSVSYAQGEGSRSVSYAAADSNRLRGMIREMQASIAARTGVSCGSRAPMRPYF